MTFGEPLAGIHNEQEMEQTEQSLDATMDQLLAGLESQATKLARENAIKKLQECNLDTLSLEDQRKLIGETKGEYQDSAKIEIDRTTPTITDLQTRQDFGIAQQTCLLLGAAIIKREIGRRSEYIRDLIDPLLVWAFDKREAGEEFKATYYQISDTLIGYLRLFAQRSGVEISSGQLEGLSYLGVRDMISETISESELEKAGFVPPEIY